MSDEIKRTQTDCLYPSFEQVEVVSFPKGDGVRVSDEGGAARSAWQHGREITANTDVVIADAAKRYGVSVDHLTIYADTISPEWEPNARLAVANASAAAARALLADT